MLFTNIHIVGRPGLHQMQIRNGRIHAVSDKELEILTDEKIINCNGGLAFPGLINSHDHLEFNLFPPLGNRIYENYVEWGEDIHRVNKQTIENVLKIPLELRAKWGIYKNLINGVTTVIHHGRKLNIGSRLITVYQKDYSIHSPALEKNWRWKLNFSAPKRLPVVMHVGEGTDDQRHKEIDSVIRWNLFRKKLVAVHGIAMNQNQAKHFKAIVWCPVSNLFLFGKTAAINHLKSETKILFGTDSTLTGSWNIWEHLRVARQLNQLTDEEIFSSITETPNAAWQFLDRGSLAENNKADIVITRKKDRVEPLESFFQTNPEDILLVLKDGEVVLYDQTLSAHFTGIATEYFSRITLNDDVKYVKGNLAGLINDINAVAPGIRFPLLT